MQEIEKKYVRPTELKMLLEACDKVYDEDCPVQQQDEIGVLNVKGVWININL